MPNFGLADGMISAAEGSTVQFVASGGREDKHPAHAIAAIATPIVSFIASTSGSLPPFQNSLESHTSESMM